MSMSSRQKTDAETIRDFGAQWLRYPESRGYYASVENLQDHFGPLLHINELRGRQIADIGSGAGRIVHMLLEAGAANVVAIEPSASFTILDRDFSGDARVKLVHDSGEAIGRERQLDFVLSIGVLHHIIDPQPIVRAAHTALRPGGRMIVWLYGHEGTGLYRATFGVLRKGLRLLPDGALSAIASLLNVPLGFYIAACGALPLPLHCYMREHLSKIDRVTRKSTIFDQLNPAYAKHYTEAEARTLIEDAGFSDVRLYHRHGYSWTVIGTRV